MEKIMHFLRRVSLVASLLVLSSCGSGGGSGGSSTGDALTPASTQLSGIASKGPVVSGTVTAYSIVGGLKGVALASKTSDSSGKYTLDLGVYTGPVLIEVTGGSYKDEATGNTVALASTLRSAIANVVPNKSGSTTIVSASITPLTEAVVKNAVAAGGLTVTNIQTANDDVKTQLGFDPVSTQPADATNLASATANVAAKAYAVLLGTVSQYLKDNPSKSLDNATSDFAIAYKAGGGGPAGNPLIAAAGNSFGANAANHTGVSNMAALQTLTANLATIDDEDPVSQRTVAAALFKDDSSISGCGPDSVTEYQSNTCSVMFNHNLSGMPGCFNVNAYYSNYIGHYQNNDTGIDWKTPGFSCANSSYDNIYKYFVWGMNDGRVMDGTHNGIDFVHKNTNHAFYAIAPGKVIRAGTDSLNTIAIYLADPSDPTNTSKGITTLYLHASSVSADLVSGATTTINVGDLLGYQGNTGLSYGAHVHVSVRVGKSICACSTDPVDGKGGYLPPVATLLTYLKATSAPTPNVSLVSPASMTTSATSQSLVITGSNFSLGNVVQFKWGQGSGANVWTNSISTSTMNSSNQITASMIPGVVADTIYVRVCSGNGSSNCSDGTQSVSVTAATVPAAPSAPAGVTSTAGDGQTTISWNAVTGATSYNLYMASVTGVTKSNHSSLTSGVKVAGVTSPYIQTGLTNGTPYYFVATAVNANGESNESTQVSATPQVGNITASGHLNDTGITTGQCYQAGSDVLVACTNAEAIALNNMQDGMIGRDANAATNNGTDGLWGFSFAAVPGGCVQDNVTGLVWEVKTTDGGLRDMNKRYTYYGDNSAGDASAYPAAVSATNLCGYSDWRLPTVDELLSIIDYSPAVGPRLDVTWFPNTNAAIAVYWAAQPVVGHANLAWSVGLEYGFVSNGARSETWLVRLVRGGSSQAQTRYTVSADGQEVADGQTNLIWRRCSEGMVASGGTCTGNASRLTNEAALQLAVAQAISTGKAWRLPNVKELSSIVDYSQSLPAIDPTVFPVTAGGFYWTATPVLFPFPGTPAATWEVYFGVGGASYNGGRTNISFTRLVRDGSATGSNPGFGNF